jgi:hypothetical protein
MKYGNLSSLVMREDQAASRECWTINIFYVFWIKRIILLIMCFVCLDIMLSY